MRAEEAGRAALVVAATDAVLRPAAFDDAEWVAGLVAVADELRRAVESLLSGVVVAEDVTVARKLVEQRPDLRAPSAVNPRAARHGVRRRAGHSLAVRTACSLHAKLVAWVPSRSGTSQTTPNAH
ncbi:hypothetical protein [Sphaerisporangium melleum]|uniref:hypothetical protein n=1 Tax=Sphaerisporangium melleum TaxID=321316 RepID=UPI00355920F3